MCICHPLSSIHMISVEWYVGAAGHWSAPDHARRQTDYINQQLWSCVAVVQLLVSPRSKTLRDCYFSCMVGASCVLKWLWKLTQATGSFCFLPPQIKFFIDPYRVVGYFKTCPIQGGADYCKMCYRKKTQGTFQEKQHKYDITTQVCHLSGTFMWRLMGGGIW